MLGCAQGGSSTSRHASVFDHHPMIPLANVFQGVENDRYFSKINPSKGYWQIPVRQEDIPNTAFVTMERL
ncbi:RNA-directed DNA polymerase homolog [Plakobranchus ocellatus]|uniref:RNA-directed DNA polymerase homolog n=1 Tax=Plakobranchus ocellatus TaxID=259542 RepID=A0AAV3YX59_9GAST|nr:RNA-directed DNA polymerase homolog [Plakobranchus ocellatus]